MSRGNLVELSLLDSPLVLGLAALMHPVADGLDSHLSVVGLPSISEALEHTTPLSLAPPWVS